MSRKLKKGYFVRGEFVAEGSERDLELKAELKGTSDQSRTDLKRESTELQKLGEELLDLRADLLTRLALSDKFKDAIADAKRITNFEGKRPVPYAAPDTAATTAAQPVTPAANPFDAIQVGIVSISDRASSGQYVDKGLPALQDWLTQHPATDSQQLRALVRQARKDAVPEKPGAAVRHGRAYRDIFQLVRETLTAIPDPEPAAPTFSPAREAS